MQGRQPRHLVEWLPKNRRNRATGALVAALCAGIVFGAAPVSSLAQQQPPQQPQVPAIPDPVPVSLTPATTAVVVNDVNEQICRPQPRCVQGMVPHIDALLAQARAAGVLVVYTGNATILPEIAPDANDPVLASWIPAQDRFFSTNLDYVLRSRGVTNVILMGWRENGSVLYTAVSATLRGYTVVVADDGTTASQDYDVAIGRYQMLTQLNANPTNKPLQPNAVTLSRSDLISFG